MANFVLVHGAFHGAWCWSRLTPLLRARGHQVFTTTLTGLGERRHLISPQVTLETFVQDVTGLLEAEELTDAVLVGHSFGGSAISGAADRMPERVRHLVYLDAVMLEAGQTSQTAASAQQREARLRRVEATGGVSLPPSPASAFGVPDGPDADWINRRMTPHPWSSMNSPMPLRGPVGNGLPATYVACTGPVYEPLDWARRWVRGRPGFTYREVAEGHDLMVTAPAVLADLLEDLIR